MNLPYFIKKKFKKVAFQTITITVMFLFFSFNLDNSVELSMYKLIAPYKFAFFSNYLLASLFINYFLIPKLYLKKKGLIFIVSIILVVICVILVDEFILEQFFFPDTRGTYFPGILYTLLETLPILFILVTYNLLWDYSKKQIEIKSLKNLVRENELQFLKSQINPHFLFNNLNTLYSYALENSEHTATTILKLSSVLRYMLYDCKEDYVQLSKEIKHLKDYSSLNKLRIGNRGKVFLNTNISLTNDTVIAPLILMVFLENAFKHSTTSQSENIFIEINIDTTLNRTLRFNCKNNYEPLTKKDPKASGIGLKNVKKRLQLLYPKAHVLKIYDEKNMYEVALTLNLKSK